jgi:hypothetical protein
MWVRNSKGNVFVGNLPPDFSDERLAEAFDPFGIVLSAAVARDPNTGARLRYGFVDIATERAATKAITALDGTVVEKGQGGRRQAGAPAAAATAAGAPHADAGGAGSVGGGGAQDGAERDCARAGGCDRAAAAPQLRGRGPAGTTQGDAEFPGRAPRPAAPRLTGGALSGRH